LKRWVVAVASVIMMVGLGSFNAWSVFRLPLSEFYGANITDVNTAFFVSSLVFGLVASASALLVRKIGPRVVGVAGSIVYGLGVFLGSLAEGSLSYLYLTYGLVAAIGLGLAVMAPIAALPRWFPDRPGFAYGVAFVGFGMGPLVNVPLIEGLLSATGGPLQTFGVLGVVYTTVIGSAAWFVRYPVEGRGIAGRDLADGEPPAPTSGQAKGSVWDFREALKTWQLYALWAVFFLGTTAGLAIISDARPMAVSIGEAAPALASALVVVISIADAVGRLLWPALSDKIGGRTTLLAMFCIQAMAFLLMPIFGAGSFVVFCALCMVVMNCYGGAYGTISALVSRYYGTRDLGPIYGAVFTAAAVASFGAPVLLARSADVLGSYYPALYATAGMMIVGAIIALVVRPPDFSRRSE
jgi:OFA family oxalate/formate antiporter-like MFS transporter